jgi:hypothetical protein
MVRGPSPERPESKRTIMATRTGKKAQDTTAATPTQGRPVIVCTEYKGVFFGYADDTKGDVVQLKRSRMAIYWGTTRGISELAETGPTAKSRISARADVELRKVTSVFEVAADAAKAWEDAK